MKFRMYAYAKNGVPCGIADGEAPFDIITAELSRDGGVSYMRACMKEMRDVRWSAVARVLSSIPGGKE